jgi:hypothetical protein
LKGRSRAWLKIKSPEHPVTRRERGGSVLMTDTSYAIRIDGVVHTLRVFRDTAIKAARLLQQRHPGAKVTITDLRDGSDVPFDQSAER